jgi:hypothetical protein
VTSERSTIPLSWAQERREDKPDHRPQEFQEHRSVSLMGTSWVLAVLRFLPDWKHDTLLQGQTQGPMILFSSTHYRKHYLILVPAYGCVCIMHDSKSLMP